MKDELLYLRDLLDQLQKVEDFTTNGREAFFSDEKTQYAVMRAYEVIGEIVKRLPQSVRESNTQINWRKLVGFRDFLAHNYEELILEFVWNAVEDLPNLRAAVETLLNTLSGDEEI